jgi:hypothetical protein
MVDLARQRGLQAVRDILEADEGSKIWKPIDIMPAVACVEPGTAPKATIPININTRSSDCMWRSDCYG